MVAADRERLLHDRRIGRLMVAGSRCRDAAALIGVLTLVTGLVGIVQEVRTSDNPINAATVYGAYLGAAALTVTLLGFLIPWWWRSRGVIATPAKAVLVTAAADQLAQRMLETWRQEAKDRRISTPAPIRVRWQWGPAEVTPPPAEVLTDPVAGIDPPPLPEPNPDRPGVLLDAGVVTQLHDEVYRQLPHGRLVLLGGPGAGKTGAMILLLLAALEHRSSVPEPQRSEVPVPVWLTLGGWDSVTQTLHQWAAATMYRDHPYLRAPEYGPDAAGELLRAGRVALFLDGLDEMAPAAQGKALARVEQQGSCLRIVLSSRTDEYRHAVTGGRAHHAAVIAVQPVDPDTARAYLMHDQIGSQHDRWTQVGDFLTHHPDSIAAHALNNPLTLSLVRATYQDQDPTPLIDPAKLRTVAALREHLIDRILISAYPDERQRAHAGRWLAWIAHHMGSDRDLAWWHIPTWIPRWQLRLVAGLVAGLGAGLAGGLAGNLANIRGWLGAGLAIGLAVGLGVGLGGRLAGGLAGALASGLGGGLAIGLPGGLLVGLAYGLPGGLLVGLGVGLAGGLGGGLGAGLGREPQAIRPRWPRTHELRQLLTSGLVVGLVGGLVVGLAYGFAAGLLVGPEVGLKVGLTVGLTVGLAVGLTLGLVLGLADLWTVQLPRAVIATPTSTYRLDRRTSAAVGLGLGSVFGVAAGLTFGVATGTPFGVATGIPFGVASGLAASFGVGLAAVLLAGARPKVRLIELVLAITGGGRIKFMQVLEDAHHRQVLRQAGAVYQFRHAELQEHLAKIHRLRTHT